MVANATVAVLRAVENFLQALRKPAVEIRLGFMHAQQRGDVESVGTQRRDRLGDVRAVETNLVHPASSRVRSKSADVDEHAWKGIRLCRRLTQFGADDPLEA